MAEKPLRAAIYARISDDTEGRAAGVERQVEDCKALAERLGRTLNSDARRGVVGHGTRARAQTAGGRRAGARGRARPDPRGWPLNSDARHVFVDNDISASTKSRKRRPEYDALMAGVSAGEAGGGSGARNSARQ